MTRSRKDPDLITIVQNLERRIKKLEASSRSGNTSMDFGELVLNGGSISIVDTAGNVVFRLSREGNNPSIIMTPIENNVNSKRIKIKGFSQTDAGTQLQMEIEDFNGAVNGGQITITENGVLLRNKRTGIGETSLEIGADPDRPRALSFKGLFYPGFAGDTDQAIITGSVSVPAGFSSADVFYGSVLTGNIIPIVSVVNSLGAVSWTLTNYGNSSFTVAWVGTDAKTINYWAYATP